MSHEYTGFVCALQPIEANGPVIPAFAVGIGRVEKKNSIIVEFIAGSQTIEVPKSSIDFFDPANTGDSFERKVCNVCHRLLPAERFARNQNGKGNRIIRRPSCDDCRKIIDGAALKASERARMLPDKPYMVAWKCPICQKITIPGLTSSVVLDHDHATGDARAWIYDSCNTGLGRFKDSVELLQRANEYLERYDHE